VTIGDIQSRENETMTELGQEHIVTINAWTILLRLASIWAV